MPNKKNSRYLFGILIIAAAAGILAVMINLYALIPGGLSLLPVKLTGYTLSNAFLALVPALIYTGWYMVSRFLVKRKIFSSYRSNGQKQPVCIVLTVLLCTVLEILITTQITFPSSMEQIVCSTLSVIVYTVSAVLAFSVGHPF